MTQLVWLDLETTGLNPWKDRILEIAIGLATLERPFEITQTYHKVFHCVPTQVDPFVQEMHTKNGLWAACAEAGNYPRHVLHELLALVPAADPKEKPVLAGSTIHFDRAFLRTYLPEFEARFAHRHYDVSSVKLFCQSLGMDKIPKAEAHRAMDDVLESIAHAEACRDWLICR